MGIKRVIRVDYVDDFDDKPIAEGEQHRVCVDIDGETRVFWLRQTNVDKFRTALKTWLPKVEPSKAEDDPELNKKVRLWARQQGKKISDRGRIPAELIEEFKASLAA